MNILRKARGMEIPKQARRVFLGYDARNASDTSALIEDLRSHDAGMDCVVSWIESPEAGIDEKSLRNELQDSQALVLWVTKEWLEAARAGSAPDKLPLEIKLAQELHTPILPIATHNELLPEFTRLVGHIHGIAKADPEYRTKLKAQLETFLGSEELNQEIRDNAFSATVFLSYRKMDIDEARKFMKALHDLKEFEAVSIWYDNFLTAGQNFDEEIEKALTDSDGFVLLVTPNLAAKGNYVQEVEYPMASKKKKPVVCVETLATDLAQFTKLFPGTEIVVPLDSPDALRDAFRNKLSLENRDNLYLLGMAYLRGIGVERDFERAIRLLEVAANECSKSGLKAANQLADIYENGISTSIHYTNALAWRKKVAAHSEKLLGLEHPDTATSYNNIAGVYSKQGDYTRAVEWYQKALVVDEKVFGKKHPYTATSYNNIAGVYESLGDCARALELYQKALAVREKVLGKEHPSTATSYNNIALVYTYQGDYTRALEWYQKSLLVLEKFLGKEHPNTAKTYNNIALVYNHLGDYTRAMEWLQKALVIDEKVLGKEHPSTAITYNGIATIYGSQKKHDCALEWHQKALAIEEKVLGKEHPNIASTYNNIAVVYNHQRDYARSLEWFLKALPILEDVLGKEHLFTATTYYNIADVYMRQGDYVRALEWHLNALAIREKILGEKNPETASSYNNIAAVYFHQGDYASALEWFQKALPIFENVFGDEHPNTVIVRSNIASLREQM